MNIRDIKIGKQYLLDNSKATVKQIARISRVLTVTGYCSPPMGDELISVQCGDYTVSPNAFLIEILWDKPYFMDHAKWGMWCDTTKSYLYRGNKIAMDDFYEKYKAKGFRLASIPRSGNHLAVTVWGETQPTLYVPAEILTTINPFGERPKLCGYDIKLPSYDELAFAPYPDELYLHHWEVTPFGTRPLNPSVKAELKMPDEKESFPKIKDVKFAPPATIIFWEDGTKTVVKTQNGEPYDPEKALAMAISKKAFGNERSYYEIFLHWLKRWNKQKKNEEVPS